MKAELTEVKLQKAMTEYLEVTPYASFVSGTIWTTPELVNRFICGLSEALAKTIVEAIGQPVEYKLLEGAGIDVVSGAEVLLKRK